MGDDVAALRIGGVTALLTTDALSEGTHFQSTSPARAVGRAAVAASFSDLASKGGRPVAVLLDLLLPPRTPSAWAHSVVEGAERFAARYGCHVVGGDTKSAASRSVVGTVVGIAPDTRLPRRDSARPGDMLVVTGRVGRGGARARQVLGRPRASRRALSALLQIDPRLREGEILAPLSHALIDTSDGVADAAHRIAEASGVRVVVEVERLPWDPGIVRIRPLSERLRWALYGGDYELLAVVPSRRVHAAVAAVRDAGGRATAIGAVTRGTGAFLSTEGRTRRMPTAGWDPFGPVRAPARRASVKRGRR